MVKIVAHLVYKPRDVLGGTLAMVCFELQLSGFRVQGILFRA
jgi:hypothetical protein